MTKSKTPVMFPENDRSVHPETPETAKEKREDLAEDRAEKAADLARQNGVGNPSAVRYEDDDKSAE